MRCTLRRPSPHPKVRTRSIQGVVQPDPRLRAGVLSMSHGFGTNPDAADDPLGQGGCTSRLMDAQSEYDPVFGRPRDRDRKFRRAA